MSRRDRISAAILAGGRATRFDGRDKSALVVDAADGRTILERQIAALSPLATIPGDILIVGRASHPAARTIADRVEGCGPLGGLDAALAEAKGDSLLLLACDMPFVTTAFLAHLADCATGAFDAVVPRTERGYHPLCAVYRQSAADAVGKHLAARRSRTRFAVSSPWRRRRLPSRRRRPARSAISPLRSRSSSPGRCARRPARSRRRLRPRSVRFPASRASRSRRTAT